MPKISFKKPRPAIQVSPGANLMRALLDGGMPVASSCGGEGVCCKCKLEITKGMDQLSQPNDTELFLRETHELKPGMRVSCQVQVNGDIEIDASYW